MRCPPWYPGAGTTSSCFQPCLVPTQVFLTPHPLPPQVLAPRGDALPQRPESHRGQILSHLSAHRVGGIKPHISPRASRWQQRLLTSFSGKGLGQGWNLKPTDFLFCCWVFLGFFLLIFFFVFFFNILAGKLKAVAEISSGSAGLYPCHCRLLSAPSKANLHHPLVRVLNSRGGNSADAGMC